MAVKYRKYYHTHDEEAEYKKHINDMLRDFTEDMIKYMNHKGSAMLKDGAFEEFIKLWVEFHF